MRNRAPTVAEVSDPWLAAVSRADFEAAWAVCDRVLAERLAQGLPPQAGPRHLQYVWDGRPLDGRDVLVRCYHGLGDTLQFVRFLPRLRARARSVTLWAQPALLGLLASADGIDRLLPLHDGSVDADHDVDLELMEVPHALRITAADLPGPIPYLPLPGPRTAGRRRGPRRVGLAWRAGDWDASRSLPDGALARLAGVPDVEWCSLQYRVAPPAFVARDLACRDLRRQAQRMLSLDLVLSVDTMTAHLAGALGIPAWVLLPADCDWRWREPGATSRWYPTLRLFRQSSPGDWEGVVTEIAEALAARATGPARRGEEFTTEPAGRP